MSSRRNKCYWSEMGRESREDTTPEFQNEKYFSDDENTSSPLPKWGQ